MRASSLLSAALLSVLFASPVLAQQAASVRGTVVAAEGGNLKVHSREGQDVAVVLSEPIRVTGLERITLAEIPANAYVGVASMPQAGAPAGAPEVAVSIHVFPEEMRGAGEGSRGYDLAPNATMTNGAMAQKLVEKTGDRLTIAYAGGEKQVVVKPQTSLVRFVPGTMAEVKPGAHVVIRGTKGSDGAIASQRVIVGRGDVVPAM